MGAQDYAASGAMQPRPATPPHKTKHEKQFLMQRNSFSNTFFLALLK
jgi:hypothetical protein